ncbi:MAG TPA: PDZ domain-containing protein, partial [Anaeromyxobacteraceae bacterium]|nr:PDZ domain-containing protein [Anaeromyxobacteraceae bacterium]
KLVVQSVREGSPAHRAGLYAEDEVLAANGFRTDKNPLWDRIQELGPEGTLRLHVFRRDELVEVTIPLAPPPDDTVWLEAANDATPAQRSEFERWTGAKYPSNGR